jgi:hypothetical protein
MTAPMTEAEYGDRLVASTRHSAWTLLAVSTGASLAGNVWHAARVTSGSAAAMLAAAVVPVILLLGMHLTAGMAAVRREGRVHPAAHRVAVTGIAILVLMVLAASFYALRDLLLLERFHPAAATLIPLAVDVAVVVSTASLFTLTPRLRRGRSARSVTAAAPAKPRPTTAPAATSPPAPARESASTQLTASSAAKSASATAPGPAPDIEEQVARVIASRAVKQPAETIRAILAAKARGMAKQPIADSLKVHHSVVGNVLRAANAEPEPTRTLTAV